MPKELLEELEIAETGQVETEGLSMEEELEQSELVSEQEGLNQTFGIISTIEPSQYLVATDVIKPLANIINVCGGTSAVPAATTLTSNPSIQDGANGQNLTIRGTSDTGTVTLTNGNGMKMNGNITLGLNDTITFYYDEKVGDWIEKSRNQTGPVTGTTLTAEAGEAISALDVVSLVAKPTSDVLYEPTSDLDLNFGDQAGSEFLGQGFTAGATGYICKVGLKLKKNGSPTDTITVTVYSGTTAPVTLLDSTTLSGSSLTTSYVWYYPLFNYNKQMTSSGQYFLVVSRSGTNDASNYYKWAAIDTGAYAGTYNTAYRGATATAMARITNSPYHDLTFEVYKESTTATVIRKSVASSQHFVNTWVGFAEAAITLGSSGTVLRNGSVTGLSSLTPGRAYYLSDTAGAISTSVGTYKALVLVSTSTTAGEIITVQPDKTENSRWGGINTQTAINQTIDAGSSVTVYSATLLGGTLGVNGILKILVLGNFTSQAGEVQAYTRVRLGVTNLVNINHSTVTGDFSVHIVSANRNAQNSQVVGWELNDGGTVTMNADGTASVDTSVDQTVDVIVYNNGATGNVTGNWELVLVEVSK